VFGAVAAKLDLKCVSLNVLSPLCGRRSATDGVTDKLTFEMLHLCTFKTPTYRRFMSAKVGSLCAFKMRKGVKGIKMI